MVQMATMMQMLYEAEPTMVDGPSSPASSPRVSRVSTVARKISGAEEPTAMREILATTLQAGRVGEELMDGSGWGQELA